MSNEQLLKQVREAIETKLKEVESSKDLVSIADPACGKMEKYQR